MPIRSATRVTTISVNYSKELHCYKIAAEADNGASYVGRCYIDSMRDLLDWLACEIEELESAELEKGGDQNCM
jgi:hypothetical protein|nr:MAG TPA: hypothetical protein [Caudoviricetes sp.]